MNQLWKTPITVIVTMILIRRRSPPTKKKRLIKHKMSWRSREMQAAIDSLDRKIDRRRSRRSKAMCLNVEVSGESTRPKPDGLPELACELFS